MAQTRIYVKDDDYDVSSPRDKWTLVSMTWWECGTPYTKCKSKPHHYN